MKIIANCLGGSHLYGLNTINSDLDYRYIFLNTDISEIIGLNRHEHQTGQVENQVIKDINDSSGWEIRRALNLLKKGNTQILELLFNDNWLEITKEWRIVQENKYKLLDSEQIYKSLKGYIFSERKLANGERTGKLGGQRKENIDKYGYSPKNFVQLIRLCWAGSIFFSQDWFHASVFEKTFADQLIDIKLNPQKWNKKDLNDICNNQENTLNKSFDNRKNNYKFDDKIANNLILEIYLPYLYYKK